MAGFYNSSHNWASVSETLAEIKKLQADRSYRDSNGVFFIEGVRNFVQAIESGMDIEVIIYSDRLSIVPIARQMIKKLTRTGIKTVSVTPEQFRIVSLTKRASGVGAILKQNLEQLHSASPRAGLCWIVLENVRSSGNFGTLIRSSEAIGGAGFILLGKSIDPFEPVTVRASMGALFGQHLIRTNSKSLLHWIRRHHCNMIGISPDGTTDFHRYSFPGTTLLFLGEERKGLTEGQKQLCQRLVRIPMVGKADSLNLGVAGSLLMYEVYRLRRNRK